jgi:hypothetical protein
VASTKAQLSGQHDTSEGETELPASRVGSVSGRDRKADRQTPTAPFNMEAFAWEMTAPNSGRRPPSNPPAQWEPSDDALAIDVEVDETLESLAEGAGQVSPMPLRPSASSIEGAIVAALEDSNVPAISPHDLGDPSASLIAKLGSLDRVPVVLIEKTQDQCAFIDDRASFLLSLVDGRSNLGGILDACGMPRIDALRIIQQLVERRIIELG